MAIDRDKIARNALRFIQKGQFQKAIDEYKRVLSADPRDIRTRLKLIDLYGRARKIREAIEECLQVSEAYADQGFYLKAIAVYKQAVRIDAENPLLYRNMGEMYVKQGLMGDALGTFKRGVDVLRRQGRTSEAQEMLTRMEEMAPENAAIKVHLAELYLEDGNYEAFEEELSKLILQLRGEGRSQKLLKSMEIFYERSGHHASVLKRLAELYVDLGEEEKALEVIREGLATSPADRDLRLLALRAYLVVGELPEARRVALRLYEEDPEDLYILEQLAAIASARGDRNELLHAHKALAKLYGRRGLGPKEELHYRKVMEIDPEDAEARLALGEVIVETAPSPRGKKAPEFESRWEDDGAGVGPLGPDAVHDGLLEAELYLKYGIEDKAAHKLQELAEAAPDNIEVRLKLRDLCQRTGDREGWTREQLHIAALFLQEKRETEALRAYQAILEVDPKNAEARKSIEYLKPEVAPARTASIEMELDGSTVEFVQERGEERAVRRKAPQQMQEPDAAVADGLAQAEFYEAQGLVDEAISSLLRLREDHPDSPHVLNRLHRMGWSEGASEQDEGFIDLQKEVLDTAGLSLAGGFEGFQEAEVSELDDIVREFKSGISEKLDETDFETHYNLGVAYREMGLLEDAAQELLVASRSMDKAKDAYTSLAQVFQEMGKTGEAFSAFQSALALPTNTDEDRAAIQYEIGHLAEEAGDLDRALQAFEKVFEVDPGHRDVRNRIRKLKAAVVD